VNLLGKHPIVSTYRTTGHFQRKNKNEYKLGINSNNSKSYHLASGSSLIHTRRAKTLIDLTNS